MKMIGTLHRLQSEEFLPLPNENNHCDTRGESYDDRIRDKADDAAETGQPHQQQHDACHQRCHLQAFDAVLGGDSGKNHDERPGRPGNLQSATTE